MPIQNTLITPSPWHFPGFQKYLDSEKNHRYNRRRSISALLFLAKLKGLHKLSDLAEYARQWMPTQTGIINRLEERDLVQRHTDDRRAWQLVITAPGTQLAVSSQYRDVVFLWRAAPAKETPHPYLLRSCAMQPH
jgi:hypothetical protein